MRPKIVVSQCLEFDRCRYNGQMIPESLVRSLREHVDFIPVCPEVEIGLGIPRDPIKLVEEKDDIRLMQPSTKKDVTEKMSAFSKAFLKSLKNVDGFILKAASPSCGVKDVKIYQKLENSPAVRRNENGLFAHYVIEQYPGLAVEDEGRLSNLRYREHFLTKVFTLARFRDVKDYYSVKKLTDFHRRHKMIFMGYHQEGMRELGRIVAAANKSKVKKIILEQYEKGLHKVLKKLPRRKSHINVLMHVMGYFKEQTTKEEKQYFLKLLNQFGENKISLTSCLTLVRGWMIRYKDSYLVEQYYFDPFPEELITMTNSGREK